MYGTKKNMQNNIVKQTKFKGSYCFTTKHNIMHILIPIMYVK